MLKVAVLGAAGRMGQAVLECIAAADDLELAGAVTEPGDPALGKDAGENAGLPTAGVPLTDDRSQALHDAHVAIDFTLPQYGGTEISLSDYLGKKNIIITTYRAHW